MFTCPVHDFDACLDIWLIIEYEKKEHSIEHHFISQIKILSHFEITDNTHQIID
jgi:hypothetical protein